MYKKEIKKYFLQHREEMMNDISKLVSINSINGETKPDMPFGESIDKALNTALNIGVEKNLIVKNMNGYVGIISINDKPVELDILAHLDIVPADDNWTITAPFTPLVKDGRLYGRGTSDDKGPAVAAIYALAAIKALNIPISKNARVILGTDEETACRDIQHFYSIEPEAPATFSPDANYPIINTEKGGLYTTYSANFNEETISPRVVSMSSGNAGNVVPNTANAVIEGIDIDTLNKSFAKLFVGENTSISTSDIGNNQVSITISGVSTHASTPSEGCSAITVMLKYLSSLPLAKCNSTNAIIGIASLFPHKDYYGKAIGIAQEDSISGKLTICTNMIRLNETSIFGKIDCRAPLCATHDNVLAVLEDKMAKIGFKLADGTEMNPSHHVPEDTPFIPILKKHYDDYMGKEAKCLASGGGTYVHRLKNGVAFGCMHEGTDYHIHGIDEFLTIDEIITSAEMFASIIADVCK